MSLSQINTRARLGMDAPIVSVETHLSNGLPSLAIVGLPETAVRESKERVRSALMNSGFEFPNRRVTINLAPADLPKQGGRYDLAIALGVLGATGQLDGADTDSFEFIGELALNGMLRPIPGALSCALASSQADRALILPADNASEAALCESTRVFGARHLTDVVQHLLGTSSLPQVKLKTEPFSGSSSVPDLSDVRGQYQARRALEVAAAGGHNLLFYGPPGTGKSMLASRLPGILPKLTHQQAVDVASIYSLAGKPRAGSSLYLPPYRCPHHTSSPVALVGGGSHPSPGEISLAHRGVLFLDELPEFGRHVLEVLREPIESGEIHISRASTTLTFPAAFQLLAAMNPCPCGYSGHPKIPCIDTPQQIANYRKKLSGPLLDRFDLHIEVNFQEGAAILGKGAPGESSVVVAKRVAQARATQMDRQNSLNSELTTPMIDRFCAMNNETLRCLEQAMDTLALSARGAHRIIRVARTLADLAQDVSITRQHIVEAIAYRGMARQS